MCQNKMNIFKFTIMIFSNFCVSTAINDRKKTSFFLMSNFCFDTYTFGPPSPILIYKLIGIHRLVENKVQINAN